MSNITKLSKSKSFSDAKSMIVQMKLKLVGGKEEHDENVMKELIIYF